MDQFTSFPTLGGSKGLPLTDSFSKTSTNAPRLIESHMRNHLISKLQHCREFKTKHFLFWYNVGVALLLILIFGGILWWRSASKPTPEELRCRMIRDQTYVLDKIKEYQITQQEIRESKAATSSTNITNLPLPPSADDILLF